jgi:hypothetical protein
MSHERNVFYSTLSAFDSSAISFRLNYDKRLLASSCLFVCPSAWNNWAVTGDVFMKADI